jgi:putative acetyltransferase
MFILADRSTVVLRKANKADTPQIALVHRSAVKTAMPWLPKLHTPAEDVAFFRDVVLVECDIWVVEAEGVVGFSAFKAGWVDHLYISPGFQGRGLGRALLAKTMEANDTLQLWTFQKNTTARGFYAAQGFVERRETDGRDNEEKEPDILLAWSSQ